LLIDQPLAQSVGLFFARIVLDEKWIARIAFDGVRIGNHAKRSSWQSHDPKLKRGVCCNGRHGLWADYRVGYF
jgi:hypothetical protein